MEDNIKIPTIIFYRRHDGTETFKSVLLEVPRGTRMRKLWDTLVTVAAVAEAQERGSDPKDERRELRWTWYGSGNWISKLDAGIPASAEKHLLVAVQKELAGQYAFPRLYILIKSASGNCGFKDFRPGEPSGCRVFIIHGRDEKSLTKLAAFLEHRGYTPLSLSRLPARGSETIIEALERMLPEADFLVALFTPDDEGRLRGGDEQLKPRARQNVLIEAGFAVIQRRRESIIVALGETEIPSDLQGIRRIEAEEWSFSVEGKLGEALENLELKEL